MENQEFLPPDTASLPKNGHPKTVMLSTGTTLFWRIFVPVFGTVFITGFLLAFWLVDDDELSFPFPLMWIRLSLLTLFIAWLWMVRRTLWRLKRVDADDTHLYVSNYWTTVRYPWTDVQVIEEKRRLGRRIVLFRLRAAGRFGLVIPFLPSSFFDEWMKGRKATF